MVPKEKRSLRGSAGLPSMVSGARCAGEPRMLPVMVNFSPGSSRAAMPKSVSFTTPSSRTMTFSGFTSRCTTPAACACSSASAMGSRCGCRTFTATTRRSWVSKPRQTTAIPPWPTCSSSRYRPSCNDSLPRDAHVAVASEAGPCEPAGAARQAAVSARNFAGARQRGATALALYRCGNERSRPRRAHPSPGADALEQRLQHLHRVAGQRLAPALARKRREVRVSDVVGAGRRAGGSVRRGRRGQLLGGAEVGPVAGRSQLAQLLEAFAEQLVVRRFRHRALVTPQCLDEAPRARVQLSLLGL